VFGGNPWRSGGSGWYYAPFSATMPDFNLKQPAVVNFQLDALRFWLNRGVDGFRFDAVGQLVENGSAAWLNQPQNYTLMGQMNTLVRSYQRRTMVCEGPDDPRGFAAGTACGSAFAFDFNGTLINAARGNTAAVQAVSDYFKTAPASMATFLSNHDAFAGQRLWDQLGGNVAQYKLAAAIYLLLPGRPFIYYGEEIGMAGAASISDDGRLRTPMSWTASTSNAGFTTGTPYRALSSNVAMQNVAAQGSDPNGLLAFYKQMLALRNGLPSIARGSYVAPFATGSALGFQRVLGTERTVVLINFGGSALTLDVAGLPAGATLQSAYPAGGAPASASDSGLVRIAVAAQSLRVFKVLP
jgi:glycosidase